MKLSLCCLGLLALSGSYASKLVVQRHRANVMEDPQVTALGACEISSETVNCWNMTGDPDPTLNDLLKTQLPTTNQELGFKFGKRNVYLVMKYTGNTNVNFSRQTNGYSPIYYLNQGASGNTHYQLMRVVPAEESGPVVVTAITYGLPGFSDIILKTAPGSTASLGPVTLTMGTTKPRNNLPNPPNDMRYGYQRNSPQSSKEWIYGVGTSDATTNGGNSYQLSLLDRAGKPILYVDKKGVPLSPLAYVELTGNSQPSPNYNPNVPDPKAKAFAAYARTEQFTVPGAFAVSSNVDSQYVGALSITTTVSKTQDTGPYPLEPKH